jgi:hypothetical protein
MMSVETYGIGTVNFLGNEMICIRWSEKRRTKSRSDERVSVTSTGGERHEEPCHVRERKSEEACNGWASGEVPAVTGRL